MNMLSIQKYAKRFAELGYTAYIYDFCGSGAGISFTSHFDKANHNHQLNWWFAQAL